MKRDTATIKRRQPAEKTGKNGPARLYALMFVCLTLVVSVFFFAARKHFSTVDYNMRNSMLRKQLDDLESEKKRLLLVREVSLSPSEIKKAAKKYGVGDLDMANAQSAPAVKDMKAAVPAAALKTAGGAQPNLVTRTAYVTTTTQTPVTKSVKADPQNKGKKVKIQLASVVATR